MKCTVLFKKAHSAFDQGSGFEGIGNLPSPLMVFFNIHVIDIFTTHTDISHVGGHLACGLLLCPDRKVQGNSDEPGVNPSSVKPPVRPSVHKHFRVRSIT